MTPLGTDVCEVRVVRAIRAGWWRRSRLVCLPAVALLLLVVGMLSACGPDASQSQAARDRARLDAELARAGAMGIPSSALRPIAEREAAVSRSAGSWGFTSQEASAEYSRLYASVIQTERQDAGLVQQHAQKELATFQQTLTLREAQGFVEASAYQTRYDQLAARFGTARTTDDYGGIAQDAAHNASALLALWPAYQELDILNTAIQSLQSAHIGTNVEKTEYDQDLSAFRTAADAPAYQRLGQVIQGQIMQLVADRTEALPYVGMSQLAKLRGQIDLMTAWGQPAARYQSSYETFVGELGRATTLADYVTLEQGIDQTTSSLAVPLARAQAAHELAQLGKLVNRVNAANPMFAYEYASGNGIGAVQCLFDNPMSWTCNDPPAGDLLSAYQMVAYKAWVLQTNLRALMDNLRDPTAAWLPHQTDLELMRDYGAMRGQVTVVSLREQVARMYQDGKLVYWSYVTTGRVERPSPPGLHYVGYKVTHIIFQPTEPKNSPLKEVPTPIHWAVSYWPNGYYLHEAWWRTTFGPGSNLPHANDGSAWNGGSHGCINLPQSTMGWYFDWVQVGTPVIVY